MPIIAQRELITPDFTLRPWTLDDVASMNEAINDSREHLGPWLHWAREHVPLDDSRAVVEKFTTEQAAGTDFTFGVFSPDGVVLGGSGYHRIGEVIRADSAQIGMWLASNAAHKGLGPRILEALLAWGFGPWCFEKLCWRCDTTNTASIRCAQKGGMRDQGILPDQPVPGGETRDTRVFSLTREEYEATHGEGA